MQTASFERGFDAEQNVKQVLIRLVREGRIYKFLQSKTYSDDDQRGIDFKLFMRNASKLRYEIPLQVKSSRAGVEKHNERPDADIPCVIGFSKTLYQDIVDVIETYDPTPKPEVVLYEKQGNNNKIMLTPAGLAKLKELHACGNNISMIARIIGLSNDTITKQLASLGLYKSILPTDPAIRLRSILGTDRSIFLVRDRRKYRGKVRLDGKQYQTALHESKEEAIQERDQIIETLLENMEGG